MHREYFIVRRGSSGWWMVSADGSRGPYTTQDAAQDAAIELAKVDLGNLVDAKVYVELSVLPGMMLVYGGSSERRVTTGLATATTYRVLDVRSSATEAAAITIEGARSPQHAAETALGLKLAKRGATKDLAAKVYWQAPREPLSMVHLFLPVPR